MHFDFVELIFHDYYFFSPKLPSFPHFFSFSRLIRINWNILRISDQMEIFYKVMQNQSPFQRDIKLNSDAMTFSFYLLILMILFVVHDVLDAVGVDILCSVSNDDQVLLIIISCKPCFIKLNIYIQSIRYDSGFAEKPCSLTINGGILYTAHGEQIPPPLIFIFCYFVILCLFQVRLCKGNVCPAGLGKRFSQGLKGLEPTAGQN